MEHPEGFQEAVLRYSELCEQWFQGVEDRRNRRIGLKCYGLGGRRPEKYGRSFLRSCPRDMRRHMLFALQTRALWGDVDAERAVVKWFTYMNCKRDLRSFLKIKSRYSSANG